jgi:hypothetical protein
MDSGSEGRNDNMLASDVSFKTAPIILGSGKNVDVIDVSRYYRL